MKREVAIQIAVHNYEDDVFLETSIYEGTNVGILAHGTMCVLEFSE